MPPARFPPWYSGWWAACWLIAWIGNKVTVDIRARLFEHFQALSLSFFEKRTVGSVNCLAGRSKTIGA